jgi:drug/metabolite transporter (DMT)-like permease
MEKIDIGRTWVTIVTLCVLVGCGLLVWYTLIHGNPANGLHATAQSWAFTLIVVILAGLGFGAKSAEIIAAFRKPQ